MGPEHFWWGVWGIFPFIALIAIIIIISAILRCVFWRKTFRSHWMGSCHTNDLDNRGSENAIDILKKRYASGEITKEEFEQIRKDIIS
jgi:putative membrane protein